MLNAVTLRDGLREQVRVINALVLREIRARFGQKRLGYAWALLEPTVHIAVLYALRNLMHRVAPQHIPLLLWLITGIVSYFMFRGIVQRTTGAAKSNAGILVLPPVKLMDIIWARTVLGVLTVGIIMIVYLGVYDICIEPIRIHNPLRVIACLLLLAFTGMGFGMILLSLVSVFPATQPVIAAVLRVLYFASGVIFSVNRIPHHVYEYLQWNPLLHVMESLRAAFFENYYPLPWASDLQYAFICALCMWVLGSVLVKRTYRIIIES